MIICDKTSGMVKGSLEIYHAAAIDKKRYSRTKASKRQANLKSSNG
jgi:hypothetical protein